MEVLNKQDVQNSVGISPPSMVINELVENFLIVTERLVVRKLVDGKVLVYHEISKLMR